jgi:hypothetical protein
LLLLFQLLVGAVLCETMRAVRVREQGEGSAVVNDASTSTETEGSVGVASHRRPETLPRCLHALRCRDCQAEHAQHSQRLQDLCTEVRELRQKHEELVARCIQEDLLSPELRDATLQTAIQNNKGASGVM